MSISEIIMFGITVPTDPRIDLILGLPISGVDSDLVGSDPIIIIPTDPIIGGQFGIHGDFL